MRAETSVITIREATVRTNRPITTTEIDPLSEVNFLRKERRANFLPRDLLSDLVLLPRDLLSDFLCRDSRTEILLTQIDDLQPRIEIPLTSTADLQPRTEMFLRTCRNLSLSLFIDKGKG